MGITVTKDVNNVPRILEILEVLESRKIKVGILSSAEEKMLKIGTAHEFGAHITPKPGKKFLTIPIKKEYKEVEARKVPGLFFYKSKGNSAFLAKNVNGKLELCYLLKEFIDIPERSFIRAGFDENEQNIASRVQIVIQDVFFGNLNIDDFYDWLGNYCVERIQEYMRDLNSPANSELTASMKGGSNPLIDNSHLLDTITFEIV